MTPERMRIVIAEECKWKPHTILIPTKGEFPGQIGIVHGLSKMPNYPADLNACHEMEKVLTPDQEQDYVERLGSMIMTAAYDNDPRFTHSHLASSDSTYRATALQRAEAFLRTIGKWEE